MIKVHSNGREIYINIDHIEDVTKHKEENFSTIIINDCYCEADESVDLIVKMIDEARSERYRNFANNVGKVMARYYGFN